MSMQALIRCQALAHFLPQMAKSRGLGSLVPTSPGFLPVLAGPRGRLANDEVVFPIVSVLGSGEASAPMGGGAALLGKGSGKGCLPCGPPVNSQKDVKNDSGMDWNGTKDGWALCWVAPPLGVLKKRFSHFVRLPFWLKSAQSDHFSHFGLANCR